jgi:hypothetical protein
VEKQPEINLQVHLYLSTMEAFVEGFGLPVGCRSICIDSGTMAGFVRMFSRKSSNEQTIVSTVSVTLEFWMSHL